MNKLKTFKGACLVAATSMLPLSQVAMADVTISGWINEGIQFYDDGDTSDAVATSDNGTTLGSRLTFAGSSEVATGITAGFEVILESQSNNTPLIFSSQSAGGTVNTSFLTDGDANAAGAFGDLTGDNITVLGSSLNVGGAWGKVTVGLQSMP
ncbi:MAG: porin, partial [Gammaproteobacteria bacterium]|nr:porin [Gammaproteobacteria bacterium]